jgi:hypothetical protein
MKFLINFSSLKNEILNYFNGKVRRMLQTENKKGILCLKPITHKIIADQKKNQKFNNRGRKSI